MALRVDDPARVLARARALHIPDWGERVGEGDRQIPAIRGPNGTLIYLGGYDAPKLIFRREDRHLLAVEAETAGPDNIDHLALALPAGRMDTHILSWRTLFGLDPRPVWDLPDPDGLTESRAMVSRTGFLRLTCNVSEAPETVTNRFVSTLPGLFAQTFLIQLAACVFVLAKVEVHATKYMRRFGELDVGILDDLDAVAPRVEEIEKRPRQQPGAGRFCESPHARPVVDDQTDMTAFGLALGGIARGGLCKIDGNWPGRLGE